MNTGILGLGRFFAAHSTGTFQSFPSHAVWIEGEYTRRAEEISVWELQ